MQGFFLRGLVALAGFGLAVSTATSAYSATYYVDSNAGNDGWSGLLQTATTSGTPNGPWQSLSRVARATLAPGDVVRLRCGRIWADTLRIAQSGTTAAPIRVRPYPDGCTELPVIDGTIAIPDHNWVFVRQNVYRTMFPANLVENGQLSQSVAKWMEWSNVGDAVLAFQPACPGNVGGCLQYTSASGPWSAIASPPFPLMGPLSYTLKFSVYAPAGTKLTAMVRRGGPTNFDSLGLKQEFSAKGSWQSVSMPFSATATASNARLDLYVPGVRTRVWLRNVRVEPSFVEPRRLVTGSRLLQPAHHPNWTGSPVDPSSIYLKNNGDSDLVSTPVGSGSTYLTTGPDLNLPAGATLTPGLTAHVRSEAWHIDERSVTNVSGQRLYFDSPTRYRFRSNWGYFLTGALWMLDSPDEWFFDRSTDYVHVWMPDSGFPGKRVGFSSLRVGIDLSGSSNVIVESIVVRATETGVSINGATNVVVSDLRIEDIEGEGITANGSTRCRIESNRISRTGSDAIQGKGDNQPTAYGLKVSGNSILDSGVLRIDGTQVSLPAHGLGAINPGTDGTITQNRIEGSNYSGIRSFGRGIVQNNSVTSTCLVLNDCGGIYVNGTGNGTAISGNLVQNPLGNPAGTTRGASLAVGIYLDDGAADMMVRDNTIRGGDYGIMIHNGHQNIVERNTLFGTRLQSLWIPEDSNVRRADGDVHDNSITGNVFAPLNGSPAIVQSSLFGGVADFAAYKDNIYFALLYPRIVTETWPTGNASYTFPEWRAATTGGVPRESDTNGRALTSLGYAPYKVLGPNVVPNGNLSHGTSGWTYWNETAPYGQLLAEPSTLGPSLRLVAGSTPTLVASPNFSVSKDHWYRVSFDAKVATAGQVISVLLRRGGGGTAGYEWLTNAYATFTGSTQWTRYSFVVNPTHSVTANNPLTGELGARIDFGRVDPGKSISVTNLEMVRVSAVDVGLKTDLLTNPSVASPADVACPDQNTAPALCGLYVRFSDGAPIVWPYRLPPLGKEIIYTRDPTLVDADSDGIPDSQDRCPATQSGLAVHSDGCGIGQVPS